MRSDHIKSIQFYPTEICNQDCYFCFNHAADRMDSISADNAFKLLDILGRQGISDIDIMGGEPLLLPWMPDFINTSTETGFNINVSTNGSNPGVMRRFRAADTRDLNIGISLEGSSRGRHNLLTRSSNFDLAVQTLKVLAGSGHNPLVKTVVTRSSASDIQGIADMIRGIGISRYYLIHLDVFSKDPFMLRQSLSYPEFRGLYESVLTGNPDMGIFKVHASCFTKDRLPDGARCAGGVSKLSVRPDGSVFPCNLFHAFKEFNLGNIFTDDLSDILNHPGLDYFRVNNSAGCNDTLCENNVSCTGGCPAHGYYHYGMPDGTDIRCSHNRP